jgi:hypothetical protein
VNTHHPDLPIEPYERGNLGVVQPTYDTIYLYVAYRNLVGRPIEPSEQEALWHHDPRIVGSNQLPSAEASDDGQKHDWEGEWESQTGHSLPSPPADVSRPQPHDLSVELSAYPAEAGIYREIAIHESGDTLYSQFLNCPQDAFKQALETLKLRTAQFGAASAVVQNWIEAQKTVFANCSENGSVPDDLPAPAPAIARADRAYQQAAAYFYGGEFDQAASAFRAIANDPSSPWSTIAPYLVARALVRKATVTDKWQTDAAALGPAEVQIESVLTDPLLAPYHRAAERLRGYIEFRLHPERRLAELAEKLMRTPEDPDLAQDAIDFRLLFIPYEGNPNSPQINHAVYASLSDERGKSELLDWILTVRLENAEAYHHAIEKWNSTHSSAWLVAALAKADANSPHLSELLTAAGGTSSASPAYCSLTFYRLRLLMMQGRDDEVRAQLVRLRRRGLGPSNAVTPPSTRNLFLGFRSELAKSLDEWLGTAPLSPAMITNGWTRSGLPQEVWPDSDKEWLDSSPRFAGAAVIVLNRDLPVEMLAEAAHSPKLPASLRREVVLAAWSRALLLGNAAALNSLRPDVEAQVPALKPSIQAYESTQNPEERRFTAALLLLRFPGLEPYIVTEERPTPIRQISGSGESWWDVGGPPCVYPRFFPGDDAPPKPSDPLTIWPQLDAEFLPLYPNGHVRRPAFLTAKDLEIATRESRQLAGLGPAPDYLSKEAIDWANAHPDDPRAPEALSLAVRSTRWGCVDKETGHLSKTAFEMLRSRYPKSTWARETKYWFQ